MAKLRRELGLFGTTFLGLAIIIGAGIYSLIGKAAGISGDAVWISFVLAGVVSAFTGLSFAELASVYPKSGAIYVYIRNTYRNKFLAFLLGWVLAFELIVGASMVALALGGYAQTLFPLGVVAFAVLSIIIFTAINFLGIKESSYLNDFLAVIEIAGLVFIIILGLFFATRQPNLMEVKDFNGIAVSAALVFFAYLGFEAIAVESEEARVPKKTIPKAILLSVGIAGFLFILTAVASVRLLSPEQLSSSSAPVMDAVAQVIGSNAWILSAIAIAATASTILVCLITGSRLIYGIAEEHALPKFLVRVNKKFATPHYAILVAAIVCLAFVFYGDIRDLAEVSNFGALLAFVFVNFAVVIERIRQPKLERGFRIPLNVAGIPVTAVLGVFSCIWLMAQFSQKTYETSVLVLLAGALAFLLFGRTKRKK